jgi:S-adenosylmethionine:tRNA ribosyltransferase-isomerase
MLKFCEEHGLEELVFTTRLMIVPGYRFRTIYGLMTNFHMPGSTLLLLIAAFIGDNWRKVYDFALDNHFRFLSYGDSSLLLPLGWSGAKQ